MSKRSNKGNAYFYAKGQGDKHNGVVLTGAKLRKMRLALGVSANKHASMRWADGYRGF